MPSAAELLNKNLNITQLDLFGMDITRTKSICAFLALVSRPLETITIDSLRAKESEINFA